MSDHVQIRLRAMPGIAGREEGRVILEGGRLAAHTTIQELALLIGQEPTSLIVEPAPAGPAQSKATATRGGKRSAAGAAS